MIDRARLLAWLRDKTTTPNPVVHAVYIGLAERIDRGDFDTQEAGR